MSNIALGSDGNEHYADDFHDSYVGDYFCPGKGCGIPLVRKAKGFEEKEHKRISPYFSAYPSAPHIKGCSYAEPVPSASSLAKSGFQFDGFCDRLMRSKGVLSTGKSGGASSPVATTPTTTEINTVKQMYYYCVQHSDDHVLPDGKKIKEIYQEERNEAFPNRLRSERRLIKLNFKNCNLIRVDTARNCLNIWCYFPHTKSSKPPATYYTLGFKNSPEGLALMKQICERLTPLKRNHGEVHIVVCGEWERNHCNIVSKKQISII